MHRVKTCYRAFSWLGLLVLSGLRLWGLTDYSVRVWQSEDGLPNNIVQAIAQTRSGYLWVGTREGLARFDGEQFHQVKLLPQPSQPSVLCLFASGDGSLWIGTDSSGIFHLSGETMERLDVKGGNANYNVYEIQQSADGAMWFGTTRGILRWNNGKLESKKSYRGFALRFCADKSGAIWLLENGLKRIFPPGEAKLTTAATSLPTQVRTLYCDSNNTFWVGTDILNDNALIQVKEGAATNYKRGSGPGGFVSVVFRDSRGEMWVGSYSGLSRFVDNGFVGFRTSDVSSYRIYCVFEDREQNLWIGSEEGLTRLTPKRFQTITKKDGLSLNTVVSVCPSRDGSVWISSWGAGINHYCNGVVNHLTTTNGLKSDYIMAMAETRDGSLWLGADYGGPLQRIQGEEISIYSRSRGFVIPSENATTVLCESSKGPLWIGNRSGLQTWDGTNFTRFNTRDGLPNNSINALCEGPDGAMWIGTDSGLAQWKNGKILNVAAKDPRLHTVIFSFYCDSAGTLWIGTKWHGLLMMKDGKVVEFNSRRGLFSDFIYSILEDDHTNLWLNSSRGIFRVNRTELESIADGTGSITTSVSYGRADGILASGQFRDVTQPAACKDNQGRLWFRTTQGAVVVDPEVAIVTHPPPPVIIQRITADNKDMATGDLDSGTPGLIRIPPGRGELDIQFAALSYTAPEKNLYRYKLSGVNDDWVNSGNLRLTKYNNLPPGRYHFQVIAGNNDGVWNKQGQSVDLILEPHFWQTWWFFSICGISAFGFVGGTARQITRNRMQKKLTRLEQQRAIEQERTRIARDVHDELGAKLTRISFQGGIATRGLNDPSETRRQIEEMSAAAREAVSSLHEIIWAADPKNDSLEGLIGQISHHAEEFFNACGIRCEVVVPDQIAVFHIPARVRHNLFLAVKESINNAAKHARATLVLIQINVRANELEVLVSDNGVGFNKELILEAPDANQRIHNGLVNMTERLVGIRGRCEISSEIEGGTAIRFIIPLDEKGE
jgi:ligand-binding sensor domain-containing protein/two-component sensor histidine kinase